MTVEMPRARAVAKDPDAVLVVDDHPTVRAGIIELLADQPNVEVCAEAGAADEAEKLIDEHQPALVIIDLSLRDTSGLELIERITQRDKAPRVLVYTMHDEDLQAERALRAGASGYLMKSEPPEQIRTAVERVLKGEIYLSRAMASKLLNRNASPGVHRQLANSNLESLSDREREVFDLIGQGVGTRQIAEQLEISVKTVETYRANIKEKLGLRDGNALLYHATRLRQQQQRAQEQEPEPVN